MSIADFVNNFKNKIIQGSALEVLKTLPDNVVDCVITSPPYYGLRFYPETNMIYDGKEGCEHDWKFYTKPSNCWSKPGQGVYGVKGEYNKAWIKAHQQAFCKKCNAWLGQLGLEPHPNMYIAHLVEIFEEVKRILKKSGVFYLNIGDTYWGGLHGFGTKKGHWRSKVNKEEIYASHYFRPPTGNKELRSNWLQPKQLLMIPYRVATSMQEEGWILRNVIIWHKPNHMPHPVKDRLVSAYEPIFMFTKNKKYYFDIDSIREEHIWASRDKRSLVGRVPHKSGKSLTGQYSSNAVGYHKLGKNPGDIWKIRTSNYKGAHFATFPNKLVEKCIMAGCPKEVCSKCGNPKVRNVIIKERKWEELSKEEQEYIRKRYGTNKNGQYKGLSKKDSKEGNDPSSRKRRIIKSMMKTKEYKGWKPSCRCNEHYIPGIVLDPFAGSGTALVVARQLCLNYIGIELSKKYIKIIEDRLRNKVLGDFV